MNVQSTPPSGYSLYRDCASFASMLECTTVVCPVQQRLPLTRAAKWISWFTIRLDLTDMSTKRFPALDLAPILVLDSAAEVIPAIPLEPSARVVRIDPAF